MSSDLKTAPRASTISPRAIGTISLGPGHIGEAGDFSAARLHVGAGR